jgi:hypothetical protein
MVEDVFGTVREIRTKAYYVPAATIRLLSPQKYFQENDDGSCYFDKTQITINMPDGTPMYFPYNRGSNLPLMMPSQKCPNKPSMNKAEIKYTFETAGMSVAEQTNQNMTPSEKELLLWHWKLGHCGFQWVQSLAAKPRKIDESDKEKSPILLTKAPKVSSCNPPMCAACQLGKQTIKTPGTESGAAKKVRFQLRSEHLQPGQKVSMDQYHSSVPGRLPNTKGKESKDKQYCGGTIFVDHATGYIFAQHQVSLSIVETARAKCAFERKMMQYGHKVEGYRADNAPFGKEGFKMHFENQKLDFSGVGAHHQNAVSERAIKQVTYWARTMMLHAIIMWPETADLKLWPFAMQHAIYRAHTQCVFNLSPGILKPIFSVFHLKLSPVIGVTDTHCSTPQIITILPPRIVVVVINIRICFVFLQ